MISIRMKESNHSIQKSSTNMIRGGGSCPQSQRVSVSSTRPTRPISTPRAKGEMCRKLHLPDQILTPPWPSRSQSGTAGGTAFAAVVG